jgi:hypothetical protein
MLEPAFTKAISTATLSQEKKWTRFPNLEIRTNSGLPTISDFFQIRRGLATGNNKFFIIPEAEAIKRSLPQEVLKPILPSPRYIPEDEIKSDKKGFPLVKQKLFLIDSSLKEAEIKQKFHELWAYLEEGKAQDVDQGYLCSHRTPWYSQEKRPPAPNSLYISRT